MILDTLGKRAVLISPNIGYIIRTRRIEKNMSMEDLEEKSSISGRHIGSIERGEVNPTLVVTESILAALGLVIRVEEP